MGQEEGGMGSISVGKGWWELSPEGSSECSVDVAALVMLYSWD